MALWCGEHQGSAGNLLAIKGLLATCANSHITEVHNNAILTYLHRLITTHNSINSSSWQWEDVIDDIWYKGTCGLVQSAYIKVRQKMIPEKSFRFGF